jgi:hypothetical protein
MIDCPNAEMRDRLPDLLHEQLDESARAAVLAHVADCPDCRIELALLRDARIALSSSVGIVDVVSVARMVIERMPVVASSRRRRWMDWRIAASILLLAIGGSSLVMIRERGSAGKKPAVAPVAVTVAPTIPSVAITPDAESTLRAPAAAAGAELSAAGGVSDLSDNELRTLVDDLPTLDAMPSADPEPAAVRVALPGSGRSE